ncbi:MAG: 2-oxoacid:ferredoxin oxidoreductase subunit beta [Bacteriovoracaceae bacterium]|nr:2-oxoacid:ferredoxin oxidoreductase subunit beta [Bacteriovoracaceae bacterium]
MTDIKKLTKKDFASDQEVKWCPGCGDYAILSAAQMAMAQIGKEPSQVAVISGIGCSSRFPYYMSTYGMHSIHGRAPAFATGLKLQNPDLSVWMITGDGDGLSIGGNHLAHIIRRNVNINIILFNNEIYGLTKGQYSPTSQKGLNTKSTPYGSVDRPFSPLKFAMGAGSTFFARTMDTDPKHMIEVFKAADAHEGCSVIEVYQNCVIFNDKVHDKFTNRSTRDDYTVRVEAGKPMVFGKDKSKGLKLEDFALKSCEFKDESELVVHDPSKGSLVHMLSELHDVVPMGILNQKSGEAVYDQDVHAQIDDVLAKKEKGKIEDLLYTGDVWEV